MAAPTAPPQVGLIFPPDQPPERLRPVAVAADQAGIDELWLWEDCFKQSGVATAGATLAWTEQITVGIGLLPVPLRNVALTAMEIATLARLFPGRLLPGIGHGVLDWMGQVGERVDSPMTLLREYAVALRSLLAGETVSTDGRYVRLRDVGLDWPPAAVPPVLIGAVGPKTLALAGECGEGVIIDNPESLDAGVPAVQRARTAAGRDGSPEVVTFVQLPGTARPDAVAEQIRQRAAQGATRVAVLVIDKGGAPEASESLLDFVPVLRAAQDLI